jgi:arabinogalactan endo-1,4-beta-galactosidase
MSRRVGLVTADVSYESTASIFRMIRISELRTTLAIASSAVRLLVTASIVLSMLILINLMMGKISSSERLVLRRATRRHIREDSIPQSDYGFWDMMLCSLVVRCGNMGETCCRKRTGSCLYT